MKSKLYVLMIFGLSFLLLPFITDACPVNVFIPGQNGPWDMYGYGKWLDPFGNNVYNGGNMDIEPEIVDGDLGIPMNTGDILTLVFTCGYMDNNALTEQHPIPVAEFMYAFANTQGQILFTSPIGVNGNGQLDLAIPEGADQIQLGCIIMDEWFNNNGGGVFVTITETPSTACPTPVPEPATLILMISGITGLAGVRYARKK